MRKPSCHKHGQSGRQSAIPVGAFKKTAVSRARSPNQQPACGRRTPLDCSTAAKSEQRFMHNPLFRHSTGQCSGIHPIASNWITSAILPAHIGLRSLSAAGFRFSYIRPAIPDFAEAPINIHSCAASPCPI
jgi:hypothetical protein